MCTQNCLWLGPCNLLIQFNYITFSKQHKKGWNYSHYNHNFFGASNHYKQCGELQQKFLENLVLYIYKGYKAFSTCENI
jgi:hypothetical protein